MYCFAVDPAARSGHGLNVWELIKPVLEQRGIRNDAEMSREALMGE